MNNTNKARYEMAKKMLMGRIEAPEVALMTELPLDEIIKIQEEVTPHDANTIDKIDHMDIDFGPILVDDYETYDDFDLEQK